MGALAPPFHPGKWTDIIMMTGVSGRERTRTDFEKLFGSAGFCLEELCQPPLCSLLLLVGPSLEQSYFDDKSANHRSDGFSLPVNSH